MCRALSWHLLLPGTVKLESILFMYVKVCFIFSTSFANREEFKPNKPRPCDLCRQMGHEMKDCQGAARPPEGADFVSEETAFGEEQKYIFVRLSVLRVSWSLGSKPECRPFRSTHRSNSEVRIRKKCSLNLRLL